MKIKESYKNKINDTRRLAKHSKYNAEISELKNKT